MDNICLLEILESLLLQLLNIDDDGFLSLMDDLGETKEDIRLPDSDLGKEIRTRFEKDESLLVGLMA